MFSRFHSGLGMSAPLFRATRTRVPSSMKRRVTLVGWLGGKRGKKKRGGERVEKKFFVILGWSFDPSH